MPRFVILHHDSPRGEHFDLMLEHDHVLKTWTLPRLPEPGVEMECEALADHRLAYLDYEGSISGDRGGVTRWDHGKYVTEHQSNLEWTVELAGEKITGRAALVRSPEQEHHWRFLLAEKNRK